MVRTLCVAPGPLANVAAAVMTTWIHTMSLDPFVLPVHSEMLAAVFDSCEFVRFVVHLFSYFRAFSVFRGSSLLCSLPLFGSGSKRKRMLRNALGVTLSPNTHFFEQNSQKRADFVPQRQKLSVGVKICQSTKWEFFNKVRKSLKCHLASHTRQWHKESEQRNPISRGP